MQAFLPQTRRMIAFMYDILRHVAALRLFHVWLVIAGMSADYAYLAMHTYFYYFLYTSCNAAYNLTEDITMSCLVQHDLLLHALSLVCCLVHPAAKWRSCH